MVCCVGFLSIYGTMSTMGKCPKQMRRKSLSFGQTTLGLPPPWPLAFPFLREKNSILQLAGGRLRNPHWGYLIWFAPGCWSVRPHIFWHHPACPLCLWPVSNVTQRVGWAHRLIGDWVIGWAFSPLINCLGIRSGFNFGLLTPCENWNCECWGGAYTGCFFSSLVPP